MEKAQIPGFKNGRDERLIAGDVEEDERLDLRLYEWALEHKIAYGPALAYACKFWFIRRLKNEKVHQDIWQKISSMRPCAILEQDIFGHLLNTIHIPGQGGLRQRKHALMRDCVRRFLDAGGPLLDD